MNEEVIQSPLKRNLSRAQKCVYPVSEGLPQQFSLHLSLAGPPVIFPVALLQLPTLFIPLQGAPDTKYPEVTL